MRRSVSFRPPFHSVLKRTSRRSEEARPARLAVLMLKMAPVTNYGGPGSFCAALAAEFYPALPPASAMDEPEAPAVLD